MKAKVLKIKDLLDGKDKRFVIPVYQRPYEWIAKEQCKVLFDDLQDIVKNNYAHPHFFGSIVRIRDVNTDENIIIDGQQRITTISLLMLAIAKRIEDLEKFNADAILPNRQEVLDACLDYKKEKKLKLKLSYKDTEAYECVANGRGCEQFDNKSKIVQCYKYFYTALDADNINQIYKAVSCLEVVDILLGTEDDNPQLVFESLNSKGMGLTDAAKICNFILIGADYDEQLRLYEQYWVPIENNAGLTQDDTTKYIWRFLQYKTNNKTGDKETYNQFRQYYNGKDRESVLKDMLNISSIYHDIITKRVKNLGTSVENKKINERLTSILDTLKTETTLPLLIDVVNRYYQALLSSDDVIAFFDVLESYIIRRGINGLPTSVYNGYFLMNKQIDRELNTHNNADYLDVFKYLINTTVGKSENPSDADVKDSLISRDVYNKNQRMCKYILQKIEERHNPKEVVNMGPLTIEHVMPQTLSGIDGKKWQEELGENWEQIHGKYLHTIGKYRMII